MVEVTYDFARHCAVAMVDGVVIDSAPGMVTLCRRYGVTS